MKRGSKHQRGGYKFDAKRAAILIEALARAIPKVRAAAVAGISVDTLARWLAHNADFAAKFEAARSQAMEACLREIRAAGGEDWRAAAWVLERLFPEDFGPRQKLEHSGKVETGVDDVTLEQARRWFAQFGPGK